MFRFSNAAMLIKNSTALISFHFSTNIDITFCSIRCFYKFQIINKLFLQNVSRFIDEYTILSQSQCIYIKIYFDAFILELCMKSSVKEIS